MDWLTTAVLGGVIFFLVYWWSLSKANYWKTRGIPYVKSLPFFGNSLEVVLMRKSFPENVRSLYKHFQENGHKYGGSMQFMTPSLIVCDPDVIQQIMIKEFKHFHDREFSLNEKLEPLSGGLPTLQGERWRIVRQKLTPAFTSGKLKLMFDQIAECSDEAVSLLKNKKEAIDVKSFMQKFNCNAIGMVAFGLKVDAFNEENSKFVQYSSKVFAPSAKQLIKYLIRMSFPILGKWLQLKIMDDDVSKFFLGLVKDTVEYREKTNTRRNDFLQLMLDIRDQESSGLSHSAFMNLNDEHLEAEDKELLDQLHHAPCQNESKTQVFTENCIAAQSFLFISVGNETTAYVLTFILYELAANLEHQKRVQNEIDGILSSQKFDYNAIQKMTYLEQFINEVQRLHPIGGIIGRVCTEDFRIPGTDDVIEKGVFIKIPVLALHKDPKYFPNPETFDPDRFSDMKAIPKGVFLPFGSGPRICIGMRLAMLEMKIFVAKLLSKYTVKMSEKTQTPLKLSPRAIVIDVVGGVWVHVEERE